MVRHHWQHILSSCWSIAVTLALFASKLSHLRVLSTCISCKYTMVRRRAPMEMFLCMPVHWVSFQCQANAIAEFWQQACRCWSACKVVIELYAIQCVLSAQCVIAVNSSKPHSCSVHANMPMATVNVVASAYMPVPSRVL